MMIRLERVRPPEVVRSGDSTSKFFRLRYNAVLRHIDGPARTFRRGPITWLSTVVSLPET
jgi:hypothetical protein